MRSKRIRIIMTGLMCACACLTSACGRSGSFVIITGSTSVQPYAEILIEEFALIHPESVIDVLGGGSSAGIQAVESGAADIGMSSRALKDTEKGLWSVEIAKDGLAIIVNPHNPLTDLSIEQLRSIYTGDVTNWKEVGGGDAKIHTISREEGSGTRSAFEDLVMEGERITPKAIVQDSNGAVRQLIAGDKNSIGFISLGLVDDTVKAVVFGGVAPTWDNIKNGSYSLYRPFLYVTGEEPAGEAGRFVEFTLSAEGQKLLIDEGLIPPGHED